MGAAFYCDLCKKYFGGEEAGRLSGTGILSEIEDEYCKNCAPLVKKTLKELKKKH